MSNSNINDTIGKCLLEACYRQEENQPAFVHVSSSLNNTGGIITYQQVRRVLYDCYFHWWRPQLIHTKNKRTMLAFLCDNDANVWLHYCTVWSSTHHRMVLLNTRWTPLEMAQALLSSTEQYDEIVVYYNNKHNESKAQTCQVNLNQLSSSTMMKTTIISLPNYLDKANLSSSKGSQTNYPTISNTSCRNRDDAVILFTSGTSSNKPKGVRLSHASLYKQAMAKPWGNFHQKYLLASSTPWFHIGGLSSALSIFLQGGTFVFATTPNHHSSYNTILPHVNILVLVPAMIHNILSSLQNNNHEHQPYYYEHIQVILVGGSSLSTKQRMKCRQVFPNARIIQTYACTEAGSSMTFYDITHTIEGDSTKYGGGIPVGIPHVDLKINDNGVIATRGIHVMNGYWNSTSLTKEDEWYDTNDLGHLDKETGMLYYCGRKDDVIRTGSESVVAFEVEQYLQSLLHNGTTVVVIPLPHDKYGQMICAVLQNDDNSTYNEKVVDELLPTQFLQLKQQWKLLASYKFPKRIFRMNQFPRNSNGKILKRRIIPIIQKYIQQQHKHPIIKSKL